ncbi:tyrosine-type recombinase/integrase [Burkholderia stabilis]|uniref:tyrosine-type recombinase/integrase n=1 Tax=Burkholderia stabilis TaxID=95485 RepID=UPI001F4A2A1A|nr:integrase family protein [Burkholderia stabilis]
MAKVNFTAGRISGHGCPAGKSQAFIWDSGASGLGLRATAAGGLSYIFQSKLNGGTVRVTIGSPKDWSIDDARDEARRLQRLVDAGKDPREEAAEQRAAHEARKAEARRLDVTVGDAWAVYLEARKPRWSERSYADHVRLAAPGGIAKKRGGGQTVAGPLAVLMPLKLSALTAERVAVWLAVESESRATSAGLAFRLLRAFIRWSEEVTEYRGAIPTDAYAARSVKDVVPRTQAKEGDCLEREQLPAWFSAVRQIGNPVISAYLQALLLTGARREEMAGLSWDDVDFQWRKLIIGDKVEQETGRTIPLTPYLASLLVTLPRRNEWVFSSLDAAEGRLAEPRIAHNLALQSAGLPHVTLHGLRRSFGTLAEWCEVPVGIVAQIQGHKPSAIVEKHYRRRSIDLLRKWHDKIETWMLEQAGIDFKPEQSSQTTLADETAELAPLE